MARRDRKLVVVRPGETPPLERRVPGTIEERWALQWVLTSAAYAVAGRRKEDLRMRRDVVRVIRPGA